MIDGTFKLCQSRAIMTYLVSQYGNDEQRALYPDLAHDRAKIDEMLYWEATTISRAFQELMVSIQSVKTMLINYLGCSALELTEKYEERMGAIFCHLLKLLRVC